MVGYRHEQNDRPEERGRQTVRFATNPTVAF